MNFLLKVKEQSPTESAQLIEQEIKTFVLTSPLNRLSFIEDHILWDEPLVQFADSDDPIFTEYKAIISPTHLPPHSPTPHRNLNDKLIFAISTSKFLIK